ncbi:hypothetical protein [Jeongeupia chitinilytica]|uniref:hypothetical protein n=1 Tax=Jeongeupia chitinilytica TaxID=1041641 RepID=UPI001671DA81|nr:hypothetical protein [Jeongeupia chitinilytica]
MRLLEQWSVSGVCIYVMGMEQGLAREEAIAYMEGHAWAVQPIPVLLAERLVQSSLSWMGECLRHGFIDATGRLFERRKVLSPVALMGDIVLLPDFNQQKVFCFQLGAHF